MNSPYEPAVKSTAENAADLDWQAWLYVAGELDEAARDAFEARLLADTAACEAVARAVELSDLLVAARPAIVAATAIPATGISPLYTPLSSHSSASEIAPASDALAGGNWSQRAGWMALGAAACLAVMLAGRGWQVGHFSSPLTSDDNEQVSTTVDDESRTLAVVWTELWNMEDALSPADSDDDSLDRADSVLASSSRDEGDSAPPDWLLAAVADDETDGDLPAAPQPN